MISLSDLNTDQRLESLTMMPDYCLQEIFSREISNESVAKILVVLSEQSRKIILANLNSVRGTKISAFLDDFLNEKSPLTVEEVESACEALLDRVESLVTTGFIRVSEKNEVDESFFDMSTEVKNFSDNLPGFNFNHNDLHDLIVWWNLAAKNCKSLFGKKHQVQDIILERLDDEFSSELFSLSIDDVTEDVIQGKACLLGTFFIEDYKNKVDLIEIFMLCISAKKDRNVLAKELSSLFPEKESIETRLLKLGPLLLYPAIKGRQPAEDIAMSLFKLGLIAEKEGIHEMEKYTKKFDDHFFHKGMALLLAGIDEKHLHRILAERKKAYVWEVKTKIKMISDAVLCIRNNVSPFIMLELMSSYTVYDFEE